MTFQAMGRPPGQLDIAMPDYVTKFATIWLILRSLWRQAKKRGLGQQIKWLVKWDKFRKQSPYTRIGVVALSFVSVFLLLEFLRLPINLLERGLLECLR
jgi:hypothetical protein